MIAKSLERISRAYLALLVRLVERAALRPVIVLCLSLLVTAASAFYVVDNFKIDTDTSSLLSSKLPFQQNQHEINKAFPQLRNTIVAVVDGQTSAQAEQASQSLVDWASQQKQDFQSVYQPGGGHFFDANGLLYLSRDELEDLGDQLSSAQPLMASLAQDPSLATLFTLLSKSIDTPGQKTPPALASLLEQINDTVDAANDHHYQSVDWQRIIAGDKTGAMDSTRRFIIIKPKFDFSELQPAARPIDHLRQALSDLDLNNQQTRVRLTGSAVLDNQQLSAVSKGAGWSTSLTLGFVIILLAIALRSVARLMAALLTLTFGLIWTTALGLLLVGQFNILSIAFAVLFIGLSVDFGIQICMRSREVAMRGLSHAQILPATAREIGGAITLAGLAAAMSFFSVVPTKYSGLSELGIVAGVGMIVAVLANLTVLPALLRLFKADKPLPPQKISKPKFTIYAGIIRRGGPIVLASIVAGLIALPFAANLNFDFNPLNLEDPDSEAIQTLDDMLQDERFSPYTISLLEPDLDKANDLADQLEEQSSVDYAVTLDSYIPENQDDKLDWIEEQALLLSPETLSIKELATPGVESTDKAIDQFRQVLEADDSQSSQELADNLKHWQEEHSGDAGALKALQKRILGSLPAQMDQLLESLDADRVTRESLPSELTKRYMTEDGRARIEVFSNLDLSKNRNLERFVDDVQKVAPEAAGTPVLLVEGGSAVVKAFIQASLTTFVAIALLLWLMLGRWRDVALALSPLPLAGLLTTATMVMLGMSFNLANIIVLPLLIGLSVAYGIYFVVRWRDQGSLDGTMQSSTPSAVLFSALTTACSFGSLALAPSRGMAILGQTLSLSLGFILLSTMVVLPALLSLLNAPGRRRTQRS